jgi:hypothetical protein
MMTKLLIAKSEQVIVGFVLTNQAAKLALKIPKIGMTMRTAEYALMVHFQISIQVHVCLATLLERHVRALRHFSDLLVS